MKLTIAVIVLLALGVGGLLWLSLGGGATLTNFSVERVLSGEAADRQVKMQLQAITIQGNFKPVQFTAIDIPKEGAENEAYKNAKRIAVRYDGDDKIDLQAYGHVAVEGKWNAMDRIFVATKMYTQCPSHYEGKQTPKPTVGAASP